MKKRVRARRTLYYKLGLFIIKRRFGKVRFNLGRHKRKSFAAMTENPNSSRFKVGSGVKMTTVTSKAAPKYEVIEKISCKKQCFVLK